MGLACGIFVMLWVFMLAAACALQRAGVADVAGAAAAGVCAGCGYSLAGLSGGRCPECGGEVGTVQGTLPAHDQEILRAAIWVLFACVLAHAPGVVGCVLKSTYFDDLYGMVILVAVCHAGIAAVAAAIVSTRGTRWLTVLTGVVLAGGLFGTECYLLLQMLTNPPTNSIDAQYEDLAAWLLPVFAMTLSGAVFVLAAVVVAVFLWWRGPELVIAPVERGPVHPFQPAGQEESGKGS